MLDRPVVERYRSWLAAFVQGDFGKTQGGREVRSLLWERLQVTLRMTIVATALALILALLVGTVAAVRQHSAFDKVTRVVGYLFLAVPVFWVGALLKEYAAIRLNRLLGGQFVFTVGQATPNLSGSLATGSPTTPAIWCCRPSPWLSARSRSGAGTCGPPPSTPCRPTTCGPHAPVGRGWLPAGC
jgi:ABC-type sugar transport system permease subunit